MDKTNITWHSFGINVVYRRLHSTVEGLSTAEAKKRIKAIGLNILPRGKRLTRIAVFFGQFKSALIYILLMAGIVSMFLGEHVDAYIIFVAVFLNVIIGFIQEGKAQKALQKLQSVIVARALVLRDGGKKTINATDLVPGDIIFLKAGDRIPADARLIEAHDLEVAEAALTGEAAPVDKTIDRMSKGLALADRKNMLYMSTLVSHGLGKAIVIATGINTEIGKIAKLLKETEDEATPLQKKLDKFSRKLGVFILFVCLAIFGIGVAYGNDMVLMFNTAVAIAVSAIPEGLAVAVTVILAIGMQRILKKKALVKRLVAAETLGSTTVICTDKTGTLTEGEMRVVNVVTAGQEFDFNIKKSLSSSLSVITALKIATICNNAEFDREGRAIGSATEKALLLAGSQLGLQRQNLEKNMPRIDEIPFESANKYMATAHKLSKTKKVVYFKGAPEYLLEASNRVDKDGVIIKLTPKTRKELKAKLSRLAKKKLRVVAVAYKEEKLGPELDEETALDKLIIVGFLAMKDPLRPDTKKTLHLIGKAGVRTVIITGDNKDTARAIAEDLGLKIGKEGIVEGKDMLNMSDIELARIVKKIVIYARVSPHDKLRIVKALQSHGEVVAMTGDGINDAPALKQADIGVALGSGTDIAKETADLVLINNNYSAIAAAVEQGRVIYDNIKKVILYLLSDSFSEVLLIMGSLILGWPLPLLPAQILWINLVTDGFPNMALTVEPEEKEIMSEPPQERQKPILDVERNILISTISIVTAISSLIIFHLYYTHTGDLSLARSLVFATLGVDSLLYVFSCRSLRHSIIHKGFFANKFLLLAVAGGFIIQVAALYIPFFQKVLRTTALNFIEWGIVLFTSFIVIILIELIKYIFIARHKRALITN
ncbi:HAD-IC family P-type ATPase [Patescibacteria group bacterium]|nr:HAD-IC family P-type ATPase [Patescibacteria group bacterium]